MGFSDVHHSFVLFWRGVISFLLILTELLIHSYSRGIVFCREERLESEFGNDYESMC